MPAHGRLHAFKMRPESGRPRLGNTIMLLSAKKRILVIAAFTAAPALRERDHMHPPDR